MTILHLDGFDQYVTGNDALLTSEYSVGNPSISTTGGRFGGGSLNLPWDTGGSRWLQKALPATYTELWTGAAAHMEANGQLATMPLFYFMSSIGAEIRIELGWTGISVYRGASFATTLMGSWTPRNLNLFDYHFIEARVVCSGTVGVVEVWCDGVQVINLTGVNTKNNAGATGYNAVRLGNTSTGDGRGIFIDDWYILDPAVAPNQSRLGDCRIGALVPNGDATPNNGTPSTAGAHYLMVNEAQYNTTNYNDLPNTTGQGEYYGMSDLPTNATTVYAVKASAVIATDVSTTMNVQTVIKSGGTSTEALGPSVALTTSNAKLTQLRETDPDSVAWTPTTVNAAIAGVKVL